MHMSWRCYLTWFPFSPTPTPRRPPLCPQPTSKSGEFRLPCPLLDPRTDLVPSHPLSIAAARREADSLKEKIRAKKEATADTSRASSSSLHPRQRPRQRA